MSSNFYNKLSTQSKTMIIAYFLVFLFIFGFAAYSARTVLFRPWTVREWVSAVSIGQKIFVFGGRSKNVTLHDDVLQIDIEHNTLKRIAKLPSKYFAINSVYVNDRIYLIGGYNGKQYIDDILEFHPSTKETRVIGKLPEPRAFGGVAPILGKIYYAGGWNGETYATEILQIDPKTGHVRITGHLPGPREYFPVIKEANPRTLFEVIEQIRQHDAAVADALAQLTDDFEYDTILAFIQKACEFVHCV